MKYIIYTFLLCFVTFNSLNSQVPDSAFGNNGKKVLDEYGNYEEVSSALLQPDGKILIGGYDYDDFFYYPSISVDRLNKNGTIDNSFGINGHVHIGGSPFGGSQYGGYLALQPDGKIVGLGTDFDRDGIIKDQIILFRLKPNGSYDSSFGKNGRTYINFGGFFNIARALVLKPDGKIIITGELRKNRSGTQRGELAQFLPDGKIDSSFGINGLASSGLAFDQTGLALKLLSNNKIIGAFEFKAGNENKTALIKFNAGGTIDSSFGTNGVALNKTIDEPSGKISLALQEDEKIVEYVSSYTNNVLYRYNANGSADNSFGTNGFVKLPFYNTYLNVSVTIDDKQRLLITTPDFSVSRYLPDGTIDLSFGVNGILTADFSERYPDYYAASEQVLVQPNSKILIVGFLDQFNGLEAFALARFKNASSKQQSNTPNLFVNKNGMISIYPNPLNNVLNIKGLDANTKYNLTITDAKGNIVATRQVNATGFYSWNIQNLHSGIFYLNVVSGAYKTTLQFLKE